MAIIQAAEKVVREAEEALREIIRKALVEQRYADVKIVADMADGIAKVRQRRVTGTRVAMAQDLPQVAPEQKSQRKQARPMPKNEKYPQFGRDEDRLVKVGWSKKNQKEYEHRVPKDIVLAFVQHLGANVVPNKVFDVESLLPARDTSGNEIPAYQVYVTLAWLRDSGVVEKKGRDGYILRKSAVVNGGIEKLWESVPTRSV